MTDDEHLSALFDDLEHQASAAFGRDRDLELADRGQAEYAHVTLASRVMASEGSDLAVEITGVGMVRGRLDRVCEQWFLLAAAGQEWIVRLAAVTAIRGASARSAAEVTWSPLARLGFGAPLRRLATARRSCVLHRCDGDSQEVRPVRVGADFVEVLPAGDAPPSLVPFAAIAAVRTRD